MNWVLDVWCGDVVVCKMSRGDDLVDWVLWCCCPVSVVVVVVVE